MPLENFAALPQHGAASPLQLIVDAVSAAARVGSHSGKHADEAYSVFGSLLVEIILDFKWRNFARRKFFLELTLYVVQVTLVLIWNLMSNTVVVKERMDLSMIMAELRSFEPRMIGLALLWVWTTVYCLNLTRLQIQEFFRIGTKIFRDPWKVMELLYIVFQMLVNVIFLVNEHIYQSVLRPNGDEYSWINITADGSVVYLDSIEGYPSHTPGRRALGLGLDGSEDGGGFDDDGSWAEWSLLSYSPWHQVMRQNEAHLLHMRALKGGGGGGGGGADLAVDSGVPTGMAAGAYIILQALVALFTWLRLLYYFKGILRLGTLVHAMQRIVVDIYPLLLLIAVLFIAFWSSIYMLIEVQLEDEYSREWTDPAKSIIKMVNMGLYTDMDSKITYHTRDPIITILTELYMFIVQIILLNMLIALMASPTTASESRLWLNLSAQS